MRVLVTRPEPGATRTARRLAELGMEPVLLPLSRTLPLPASLPARPFSAAAATSANGLRHADAALLTELAALPFYAVGGRTAALAKASGFTDIRVAEGEATSLARLIARQQASGPVAYLCGRVRLPDFEALLGDAKVESAAVETYDTHAVTYEPDALEAAVGRRPPDAALVYSARAGSALREIAARGGFFSAMRYICISDKAGAGLEGLGGIHIAERPDEEAMLALLRGERAAP